MNGIPFSYVNARNGHFSEDDIIDNSANINTLKVTDCYVSVSSISFLSV